MQQRMVMFAKTCVASCFIVAFTLSGISFAQEHPRPAYETRKREANENVVTIMGSGTASPYTRMAEDIQNVLDEPKVPNGLRILPILGRGGAANALDVLLLRGVDMAVFEQDDLRMAQQDDPKIFTNVGQKIHYITKLANSEFQIIARNDIKTLEDLRGKKVNFLKLGSSTQIACATIFKTLKIDVEAVYLDQDEASVQLRNGQIAAFARYAPAPHDAFKSFRADQGFHFIAIDADTVSPDGYVELLKTYSPALLKNETYQNIVPADKPVATVAGSLILVTYAWPVGTERYQRVEKFVKKLFDNIDKFKSGARHPKWKDINLAYEVPGWVRFKPASDWLIAHKDINATSGNRDMQAAFDALLKKTGQSRGHDLSDKERKELFAQFMTWWGKQKAERP
jgi:TRAP transporter TAXI family solute receptor